jgi:hypothetical protein
LLQKSVIGSAYPGWCGFEIRTFLVVMFNPLFVKHLLLEGLPLSSAALFTKKS